MRVPNWLAWWWIRASMEFAAVTLWLRGMGWLEARRRVAEATKLYLHRNMCDQFGSRAPVSGEGRDG